MSKQLCPLIVLILALCLAPQVFASTPEEISALTDLYNACCGPDWISSNHWLSNSDPCNVTRPWYGVTCTDNRPYTINLDENNLCGDIPSSISALTEVTSISIKSNSIQSLPSAIWDLPKLAYLTASNNQLSKIPSGIENAGLLKNLDLGYNKLSGSIPDSIGQAKSLSKIVLKNNYLTGGLPTSLQDLSALKYFDVSTNTLSGNASLLADASMRNLETLNLGYNRFMGTLPASSNLPRLISIMFTANQFSGTIPNNFIASSSLISGIYLTDNQLSGTIPDVIFNSTTLQGLSFDQNRLSGSIKQFKSTSLNYLDLSSNTLSGSLPPLILPEASSSLYFVNLSSNQFSGELPLELALMNNLQALYLSNNQFNGTIGDKLSPRMNYLQDFFIDNNNFQDSLTSILDKFDTIVDLKQVVANHNRIQGTVPSMITTLSPFLLQMVDFSFNNLSGALPDDVVLKYKIDLSANNLYCPYPPVWSESDYFICTVNCCKEVYPGGDDDDHPFTSEDIAIVVTAAVIVGIVLLLVAALFFIRFRNQAKLNMLEEETL